MTVASWLCAVLGLLLAWLVALASGMKSVPRFTEADLFLTLLLPLLAILFAVTATVRGGEGGRRELANGGAALLAFSTVALVVHAWAFQPSTPALAKSIRQILGLGDARWNPDTAHWMSGHHIVEAEQHHEIRAHDGEGRLALGDASRVGLTWRRLRYRSEGDRLATLVLSSDATLATLHQSAGLIDHDALFMGMGDHLIALNLPTLDARWQIEPPVGRIYSVVADADFLLAVCTEGAFVIRPDDGSILWEASIAPNHATGHFEYTNGILTMGDTQGNEHPLTVSRPSKATN